jgi:hypothetical protein
MEPDAFPELELPGVREIEELIAEYGDDPAVDEQMRQLVVNAMLFVLCVRTATGPGAFLKCPVPLFDGTPVQTIPTFTRREHADWLFWEAPHFTRYQMLPMPGRIVIAFVLPGEWMGINLWSDPEYSFKFQRQPRLNPGQP